MTKSMRVPAHSTRRRLIVAAASWPAIKWMRAAHSQAKKQPIVIGWLSTGSRKSVGPGFAAFKESLVSFGWKEGSELVIEERWADGRDDQLRPLAEELLARRPAVFVTAAIRATMAAARTAPNIPVVQANGGNLVDAGLAKSLARPGGMVTGLVNLADTVLEKFTELMLAAVPKLKRIGFLIDPQGPDFDGYAKSARRSAERYRIDARFAEVGKAEDIDAAMSRLAKDGVQGLVIVPSSLFTAERERIVKHALAHRWPTIAHSDRYTDSGALLSYGPDPSAMYRRAAYYVDRILKGTKPGDLPIEQPTKVELVVNLKTAKAIGLTIPQPFLMRADRVIE